MDTLLVHEVPLLQRQLLEDWVVSDQDEPIAAQPALTLGEVTLISHKFQSAFNVAVSDDKHLQA